MKRGIWTSRRARCNALILGKTTFGASYIMPHIDSYGVGHIYLSTVRYHMGQVNNPVAGVRESSDLTIVGFVELHTLARLTESSQLDAFSRIHSDTCLFKIATFGNDLSGAPHGVRLLYALLYAGNRLGWAQRRRRYAAAWSPGGKTRASWALEL
jgi:hypothetical protein